MVNWKEEQLESKPVKVGVAMFSESRDFSKSGDLGKVVI